MTLKRDPSILEALLLAGSTHNRVTFQLCNGFITSHWNTDFSNQTNNHLNSPSNTGSPLSVVITA